MNNGQPPWNDSIWIISQKTAKWSTASRERERGRDEMESRSIVQLITPKLWRGGGEKMKNTKSFRTSQKILIQNKIRIWDKLVLIPWGCCCLSTYCMCQKTMTYKYWWSVECLLHTHVRSSSGSEKNTFIWYHVGLCLNSWKYCYFFTFFYTIERM